MTRIFSVLATICAVGLCAAYTLGWVSRSRGSLHDPTDSTYMVHFLVGLFTGVAVLLVHCLIFTYFLGTGRWVREVSLVYQLPDEPLYKTTRELKRSTFPPALFAMLATIATAAAGAGVQLQQWSWLLHLGSATVTLLINAWAFRVEYRALRRNEEILTGVYAEVDRVRRERGLPSNEEAWRAESLK